MNTFQIVAIVLIGLGVLGLIYGGFSYVKSSDTTKLGPIELTVKDKKTVNIPVWAGVGSVVAGGALLLFASKKS